MGHTGPMQGTHPYRIALPMEVGHTPGSMSPTLFKQWRRFFYIRHEQISESVVIQDLRFFLLIQED